MSVLTTTIDNVNPLIQYLPSGAWGEGSRNAQGDPYFAMYSNGGTFTSTTTDSALAQFTFNGTGITLFGAKRPNHSFYNITLDGSAIGTFNGTSDNPVGNWGPLYSVDGLSRGSHIVQIINANGGKGGFLDLDYITFNTTVNASLSTVQDTDPSFSYGYGSQDWGTNVFNVSQFNGTSGHMTCSNGGVATYTFEAQGDAVQLFGTVGPEMGPYTVQLDNQQPVNFDGNKQFFAANTMLYAASYLGSGQHSLNITNEAGGSGACLTLDYALASPANVTSLTSGAASSTTTSVLSASRSSSSSRGGIIGGLIVAIVIVIAITMCVAVWLRRRRNARTNRTRMSMLESNVDPFQDDVPGSSLSLASMSQLHVNTRFTGYPAPAHISSYDMYSQTNPQYQGTHSHTTNNGVGGQHARALSTSVYGSDSDVDSSVHRAPSTFSSSTTASVTTFSRDTKSRYSSSTAPSSSSSVQAGYSAMGHAKLKCITETFDDDPPPPNYQDVMRR